MLRRSVLTAAIAAPALIVTRKSSAMCNPIPQGGEMVAGSSVSPIGRMPAARPTPKPKWDPCAPPQPTWPTGLEFAQLLSAYTAAVGGKPFPAHYPVASGEEVAQRMSLRPDEYMELADVADVATIMAFTGGAALGAMFRGRTGAIAAAAYVVASTVAIVVVHSANVFLNVRANTGYGPDPQYFYVNGNLSAWVPNPGSFSQTIPVPTIPFPGGGNGFVIPTYLLL